jgi:hypothetical protein
MIFQTIGRVAMMIFQTIGRVAMMIFQTIGRVAMMMRNQHLNMNPAIYVRCFSVKIWPQA